MKLQDVYHYFQSPPPVYLGKEVAVCYILAILIDNGESYGTALIQHIKAEHPPYRLSDTVLYSALEFLTDEGMIQSYWQNAPSKGRPKRMFSVRLEKLDEAKRLAQLWHQYLADDKPATAKPS
ncbi:PadR family transcriptional regulator [Acaryochloris sp. CCMEE 5410]|uniref:PadR family transcriptional regulator n=1 Tax=Acaryochloris sp. CCMEE 5410 TaxID=310037 RepID=UPI0002483D0A|nr:helix-turn-helix transcriptional regulator [Acaryochloris sp. CCMEE 5410]KAI9129425.1 helix-turn-helix transcriptional regulator [Acaryochloris sp. CCMEE 5410]